jgi:hypothetical protein
MPVQDYESVGARLETKFVIGVAEDRGAAPSGLVDSFGRPRLRTDMEALVAVGNMLQVASLVINLKTVNGTGHYGACDIIGTRRQGDRIGTAPG